LHQIEHLEKQLDAMRKQGGGSSSGGGKKKKETSVLRQR
jgi:hypothetical protein